MVVIEGENTHSYINDIILSLINLPDYEYTENKKDLPRNDEVHCRWLVHDVAEKKARPRDLWTEQSRCNILEVPFTVNMCLLFFYSTSYSTGNVITKNIPRKLLIKQPFFGE